MKMTESKRPMKIKTIARVGDRNQQEKIEKLASINHSMYAYTCHLRKKRKRWKIKWDDGSIFSFTGRHRTCCLPRIVAFSNKILPLFKLEKKKRGGGGWILPSVFFVKIPELAIELNTKLFHPVKTWKMRIPPCRSATKQFTSKKNDTRSIRKSLKLSINRQLLLRVFWHRRKNLKTTFVHEKPPLFYTTKSPKSWHFVISSTEPCVQLLLSTNVKISIMCNEPLRMI
jgi:hypothetical protein